MPKPVKRPQSTKSELLKAPDAAAVLNISLRSLWYLAKCGELSPVRVGGSTRWAHQDILAYIDRLRAGRTRTKRRRANDAA